MILSTLQSFFSENAHRKAAFVENTIYVITQLYHHYPSLYIHFSCPLNMTILKGKSTKEKNGRRKYNLRYNSIPLYISTLLRERTEILLGRILHMTGFSDFKGVAIGSFAVYFRYIIFIILASC